MLENLPAAAERPTSFSQGTSVDRCGSSGNGSRCFVAALRCSRGQFLWRLRIQSSAETRAVLDSCKWSYEKVGYRF